MPRAFERQESRARDLLGQRSSVLEGNIGSAVPWIARVCTPIEEIGVEGTSPSGIKPWFSEEAMSRARTTSRRISSRQATSSNGRSPPARMRW